MAPIKFEENIKDKLKKRTIEPSDNAWERLSDKLDVQEGNSKNKVIWWFGIAASLVGVFLITTLFFKTGEVDIVLPTLVEQPIEETIDIKKSLPEVNKKIENESITNKEVVIEKDQTIVKDGIKKPMLVKKKYSYKSNQEVLVNISKEQSGDKPKELNNSEVVSTQPKINEVLAQYNENKKEANLVLDSEIESLLENAQKDLLAKTIKKENTKIVDANSLLQNVETDLDKSFRDKMFNTLISSYETVRIAVAERND